MSAVSMFSSDASRRTTTALSATGRFLGMISTTEVREFFTRAFPLESRINPRLDRHRDRLGRLACVIEISPLCPGMTCKSNIRTVRGRDRDDDRQRRRAESVAYLGSDRRCFDPDAHGRLATS